MERMIKYNFKEKNLDKIDAEEDLFFTYLKKEGICETEIKNQLNMLEKKELHLFWTAFGYKYMGALAYAVKEKEENQRADYINKRFSQEKDKNNFLIWELLCLYFDIWDKHEYDDKQVEIRNRIAAEMEAGIKIFENREYSREYIIRSARAAENYLKDTMTRKERVLIQELPCSHFGKEMQAVYPLTVDGTYMIGVVNPWPGDQSAEAEVLSRMKAAADDIGLNLVMLDNFGHILDENTQKSTGNYIQHDELEFVITTHYDSEKTIDAFYYHTLWNPPEIPLNLSDYDTRVTNNYLMNDDYLIYDFGGMSNHLKGILMNKPRTVEGASGLTASFPMSRVLPPKLEEPKLFYCGMNWEKVVSHSSRHEGLFQLLDETGKVKFFGPDKVLAWGGLRPWEGYQCYQYSIPFDGFSILKEINECGICLVLSSDIHRRAGAVTNRAYEACAAGAVIISDDNEFMQYYFKDCALFIDYNKNDPRDTFEQIMKKYQWIIDHKEKALELAKCSQEIFRNIFSLDKQIMKVVNQHFWRAGVIGNDLFAKDEDGTVLVTYVVNTLDLEDAEEKCLKVIQNVHNQYYGNIILGIVCDQQIQEKLETYIQVFIHAYEIISVSLYDKKGCRQYTDGQAIGLLRNHIKHDYWIHTLAHEVWFYDHITTLIRTMQDENAACSYAGRLHKDKLGYSRVDFFDRMHLSTVFSMNHPDWLPIPGQILFRSKCHSYVPDYMFDCLDGYEHYAYLGMSWIKYKQNIAFSRRLTCCWCAQDMDQRNTVLKAEYQIRYIRDLLRFDIPDGGIGSNHAANREYIRQYMHGMPLRAWFKMRCYKAMLRMEEKFSQSKRKKIRKKYEKQVAEFMKW